MKLNRSKLIETIRRKNDGWTTYQVRKIAGISVRRVNQVWNEYLETNQIPEIGRQNGRPRKPISAEEERIVNEAYTKYRVCASTLRRVIDRDYGIRINHNRIHRILIKLGYAKPLNKKYKRKKDWVRYERRHSLTAVHIDWYYDPVKEKWVFAVIDDASRKMLALLEVESATTNWSIEGMKQALKHGKILQCISDHGAQFIHILSGESRFKAFLEKQGIKQILCRIKHPQSNGKVEKWFQVYKNHRHAFVSKEEFLTWYNNVRPHLSLRINELETPAQAFERKMKAEA
jgi:putative transposase